jgi:hypothetical protein
MSEYDPEIYKEAARKCCEALGQNPDEMVSYPHPKGYAVHVQHPRWMSVAVEMYRLDVMMACLKRWKE